VNINATLFGQMITFILFVWFTKRYVWPPVFKALKERQSKIADGLAAAERGHVELADALKEASLNIKKSKEEAGGIILDSKKQADVILDQARQNAREEGQRIIQQAHAEVQHMIAQAKEELRKQVAAIALAGAEKILQGSIDTSTHRGMLEKLAEEI
jgi:F-type H+-transporting ATPase subunit b